MPRRIVGAAAFAGVALGGAALGYLAERRTLHPTAAGEEEAQRTSRGGRPLEVASLDGTRLHAEAFGAQGAPTLILAHGVGLSSGMWHHQCEALASELHVVAYDHRGHGSSERADDCSIEALGHDLAAVIEQCAPEGPVLLGGHSMGGMAILSLAEHHPDLVGRRVAGAVLCNTSSGALLRGAVASGTAATLSLAQARLAGSRLSGRTLLRSREAGARPSTDLSLLLARHFGMTGDAAPDVVAYLEGQLRATPPLVLAAFAPALASVDLRAAAAALRVPTLVIMGERDRITPPRQGRKLVEALADGRALELEGVGHTAMLEAPDAVTDALRRFVGAALARDVA